MAPGSHGGTWPRTVAHSELEMFFLPGRCGQPDSWLGDYQAIGNVGSFRGAWRGDRGGRGGTDTPRILFSPDVKISLP